MPQFQIKILQIGCNWRAFSDGNPGYELFLSQY